MQKNTAKTADDFGIDDHGDEYESWGLFVNVCNDEYMD